MSWLPMAAGMQTGLLAALRLARGRPDGVALVEAEPRAVGLSFWAMALALPAFLCLRLIDWVGGGPPAHPAHDVALDLVLFVVGWLAYVELSRPVVALLGQAPRWKLFVTMWNWCNVIQYFLLVVAAIPGLLGAPDWLGETASVVAVGWALWLEWFAAKVVLGVPGLAAAMLVVLDLFVGFGVAVVTSSLT